MINRFTYKGITYSATTELLKDLEEMGLDFHREVQESIDAYYQEPRTVTGYMCQIDWDHEIGHASDGNKVYPTVEALKREHKSWEDCGIVEVTVTFNKVIHEPDLMHESE
jgi:hypothetical protein